MKGTSFTESHLHPVYGDQAPTLWNKAKQKLSLILLLTDYTCAHE